MLRLRGPVYCSIELTPACNNQCYGCTNVFPPLAKHPFLSLQELELVISKLRSSVYQIKLTGGEPTLRRDFLEIVKFIDEADIDFSIFSNGCWPRPTAIVKTLLECRHFRGFVISLHGSCAQSHERFTGREGSFEEAIDNIRRAVKVGLYVATNSVIFKGNVGEIREIAELSASLGCRYAIFSRYYGEEIDGFTVDPDELRTATVDIAKLRQEKKNVTLGNCVPPCFSESLGSGGCLAGVASFVIDPWGKVRPCTVSGLICGDLLTQALDEIWHSETLIRWTEVIPELCHGCAVLADCYGGCKSEALRSGLGRDPLSCNPVTKANNVPENLTLYEHLRPVISCQMREEAFGHVLILQNRIMPISHKAKEIVDRLNGETTLREIEVIYGEKALSFVGSLLLKGFIDLEPTSLVTHSPQHKR
jgi:radical SAM protein with 4Fe4S-binding SPASM domain